MVMPQTICLIVQLKLALDATNDSTFQYFHYINRNLTKHPGDDNPAAQRTLYETDSIVCRMKSISLLHRVGLVVMLMVMMMVVLMVMVVVGTYPHAEQPKQSNEVPTCHW